MFRAHAAEVTTVRGDESFELQPLCHGHQRGIDQAQKVILAKQLRASDKVGRGEIFYRDFSRGQRLDKHFFNARAETAADQIGGLL